MPSLTTRGLVLSRRDCGESARLSLVYTEELGKIWIKFSGVNSPGRKMKAFSEPLVWCEYRLQLTPGTGYAKATGGSLISSFPRIRENLEALFEALAICELMEVMTPLNVPSAGKYALLTEALEALERLGRIKWLSAAFALRFLELAGYGVREKYPFKNDGEKENELAPLLWEALYQASWESLREIPFDADLARGIRILVENKVEEEAHRGLRVPSFSDALKPASEKREGLALC